MTARYPDLLEQPESGESSRLLFGLEGRSGRGIYRNGLKRALDVLLVLAMLPVVLPLILVLALLVARDGGSPFYRQERVGRHGRIYRIWKLRTMVKEAEAALERHLALNPTARDEWSRTQKLRRDPRVTRTGRFLRCYSLDELPQLWNVLKGEMSLVGPRPMMPCQRVLYPGRAYYTLRPGITGFWQVTCRNRSSFADRAWYDTRYHRDLSFGKDLRLLLSTVRVVLQATGH
ncbi:sugar transferase [Cereibacter azotoformans]|uniref:Lipopolysaccharide/colanic/teichoic acid biosynthesis glycosyltransferase n=1 Tax=Cereibacter azotoformans TaxID=43057 RepID=A0A2T5JR77_9RHOB|nr:sugar transferase [Cereibacter azotoformans]PTR10460.1 lipopolysaccharide/colanic/teichoic acid biosynthesis glycosyltransferase [Cereibacter azotoformans]